ncbi:hypothetical protein LMG27177_04671 [Paraburkholderia fynbosensis]|uniref:Uncharacterized protein n=1 Tax=Paraburkholderia fynbosensis TaxID=1200993 RepID=A0A6J5GFL7_9BURK|nr:hypothetical protein LMG27177_04671 [Paraburkholderia fynbosensis]
MRVSAMVRAAAIACDSRPFYALEGIGCGGRSWGLGLGAWGLGLGAWGLGLAACGLRLGAWGFGPRASGFGLRASGFGLRALGFGLWASGSRLAAHSFGPVGVQTPASGSEPPRFGVSRRNPATRSEGRISKHHARRAPYHQPSSGGPLTSAGPSHKPLPPSTRHTRKHSIPPDQPMKQRSGQMQQHGRKQRERQPRVQRTQHREQLDVMRRDRRQMQRSV